MKKYASMYFRARYDGHCEICEDVFYAGDEVCRCLDKTGYRHRACYEKYRPMR